MGVARTGPFAPKGEHTDGERAVFEADLVQTKVRGAGVISRRSFLDRGSTDDSTDEDNDRKGPKLGGLTMTFFPKTLLSDTS